MARTKHMNIFVRDVWTRSDGQKLPSEDTLPCAILSCVELRMGQDRKERHRIYRLRLICTSYEVPGTAVVVYLAPASHWLLIFVRKNIMFLVSNVP